MSEPVSLQRHDNVALITIDNPPVNAISHAVRSRLLHAIIEADLDPTVRVIVLQGAGRNFIAGADIREMDRGPRDPLLNDVLLRLEACGKPVVAVLHGAVLGGGFEAALASHYRCGAGDAQLGFPEVKLGLLPGSGGTQRLPRAVGAKMALDMMTSGEPVDLVRARALGLVDRVLSTAKGLSDAALDYARELAASEALPRRMRDRAVPDVDSASAQFFAGYRRALPRALTKLDAVERIIQCVEASVSMPFEAAMARSRVLFEECRLSTQSAALRHLFFAERGSRAGDSASVARTVERVAVLGAGTMGAGIAASCVSRGLAVTLFDLEPAALAAGLARVESVLDGALKKGKLSQAAVTAARERLRCAITLTDAASADLVIEAVFESLSVKQDVFRGLDEICKPGAVLATNTSTLDVDAIAGVTRRPQDVVGLHFFSPAHVMRLVEVVRGRETSEGALATALAVTKRIGKIGVVVGNCFGFVGNRMLYAYGQQNQLMMLEGVAPERIDRVLEEWGMALGPNAVGDLAGLDVGYRARRERKDPLADPRYYRVSDMLAQLGRHGQKTGRGFYLYEEGSRQRRPDPEVPALIRAEARRLGVAQRDISDTEIVERCIYALVNEGARILGEGIAASASDLDVIWVNGYGFPRTRGGPMFHADTVGLPRVLEAIRRYEREHGSPAWAPAPLLMDLVETGDSFGTMCASGTAS